MNHRLIESVLLVWPLVVAALFWIVGPRRAVLIGIFGGLLFLPISRSTLNVAGIPFPLHRDGMTGVGLVLGVLNFDRRTLLGFRPRWPDFLVVVWFVFPLIGLASEAPGAPSDIYARMVSRGLGWVIPYAMGRIYFGQGDGSARVVQAIVISGLSMIPVCLFEEIAGPQRYLQGLIYQIPYMEFTVDRLGGWRPEGFLGEGLSLAAWMALASVMATWLWLEGRRIGRLPTWLPSLALCLTTLSCRGVYGYILMSLGIATILATRATRSRFLLVGLALIPLLYMGLRGPGLWDGSLLVRGVAWTGREGTVSWRLLAEDEVIRRVMASYPAFGFGNEVWRAGLTRWPDGLWLQELWRSGLVGLTLALLTWHVVPAGLALTRPRHRPSARESVGTSWALASWPLLLLVDHLHNAALFFPLALIAGTLVGESLGGGPRAVENLSHNKISLPAKRPALFPLVVTVLILILIEILGQSRPRSLTDSNPPRFDLSPQGARP